MKDDIQYIFNYWVVAMDKNPNKCKLTPKRSKAIKDRLREGYEIDDIKDAINGCRQDAWSMGANPRNKPFNDIELICRSGEKLEHFAENTVSQHATAEELNEPSCFDMKPEITVSEVLTDDDTESKDD
jgi:hypothetical protein